MFSCWYILLLMPNGNGVCSRLIQLRAAGFYIILDSPGCVLRISTMVTLTFSIA